MTEHVNTDVESMAEGTPHEIELQANTSGSFKVIVTKQGEPGQIINQDEVGLGTVPMSNDTSHRKD